MTVKIYGDSASGYDGKLKAEFIIDAKPYYLYMDLMKYNDSNGQFYGGRYIQLLMPEKFQMYFDTNYELPLELCVKIWKQLVFNGWTDEKLF